MRNKYDYSVISIEKDVPVPAKGSMRTGGTAKQLVQNMNEGDSVVVPNQNMYDYIRMVMKSLRYGCTMRTQDDGSVRIWRTK